ncbi:EAL domain-containing protein [Neobacillus sp. M.A.Huq-85]
MEFASEKFQLETELRNAIERKEFRLYYQPKLDLITGKLKGVEALIRWEHPAKGLVSPADFIPLAEETGLNIPIGEWVLHTACLQNKVWQEAGLSPFMMSVNISARQLYQSNFVDCLRHILIETNLSPEYLELEITESVVLDTSYSLQIIRELKRMGVQITLDDFGTGYNSLHYLTEYPIDSIKIDRSFTFNCTMDSNDAMVVKMIISLAHKLQIEVIAEGIETKDQLIFLQQHFCHQGQGYLFSKPLPPEILIQQLAQIEQIFNREGIGTEVFKQGLIGEASETARQELAETVKQHHGIIFRFKEVNGKFIHTVCDGGLLYRMQITPEQVIGKELRGLFPNPIAEEKEKYYRKAWEGKENVMYEGEFNGINYLVSLRPIQKRGQVIGVVGSVFDITIQKQRQKKGD